MINIELTKIKKTFIIAEAGSNWKVGTGKDDLIQAKKMIRAASKAGADAVKFQVFRSNTVYTHNAGQVRYLSNENSTINELFDKLSMPYEMIPKLANFCKKEKILFMATAFSVEDAKQIDPYVKIHKIASYEINHTRLLEFISQTKKPILISTGAASYDEIDFAVNKIKKNGNKNIGILQCTAKYPASIELLNLSVIPEINSKYNLPVGLSDHSVDPIIGPLMSIGLGGKFIEKHFTLNKKLNGPDHFFALEPNELKLMIKIIRDGEKSKGNKNKKILNEEKDLKIFATRSIQAIKNIKKGDILKEGVNFEVLRPGKRIRGIDARFLEKVNGKKAIKNISKGNGIKEFK
jgi:N-acetylneuraminate synthase